MSFAAAPALSGPASDGPLDLLRRAGLGWPTLERRAPAAELETALMSDDIRDLAAARNGDSVAFESLVVRYQRPLYAFVARLLGDPHEAADVVQETLVQLYSHLQELQADQQGTIAPWLFRVARNRAVSVLRKRRSESFDPWDAREAHGAAALADGDPLPEELAERADLQRLLSDAVRTLPLSYAEVVTLRYAADRSFAEIGLIVGCDEGAARVRFHRAKALLRERLRRAVPDHDA